MIVVVFLMSKISKVPTVTRIAGVMLTILVAVTVFSCRRCQKISTMTTVTGMAPVLITILVSVSIVDGANLDSANARNNDGLS